FKEEVICQTWQHNFEIFSVDPLILLGLRTQKGQKPPKSFKLESQLRNKQIPGGLIMQIIHKRFHGLMQVMKQIMSLIHIRKRTSTLLKETNCLNIINLHFA
ncbi:MAG: hypothetical protein PHT62_05825, partial [Desulfotomaculaceae bacterium]|nr:hypothetical protein [Desulfotomaculaceae bacterium]